MNNIDPIRTRLNSSEAFTRAMEDYLVEPDRDSAILREEYSNTFGRIVSEIITLADASPLRHPERLPAYIEAAKRIMTQTHQAIWPNSRRVLDDESLRCEFATKIIHNWTSNLNSRSLTKAQYFSLLRILKEIDGTTDIGEDDFLLTDDYLTAQRFYTSAADSFKRGAFIEMLQISETCPTLKHEEEVDTENALSLLVRRAELTARFRFLLLFLSPSQGKQVNNSLDRMLRSFRMPPAPQ